MRKSPAVFHWLLQRVSAVALVPLVFWVAWWLIPQIIWSGGQLGLVLQQGGTLGGALLFTALFFYHGALGVQVVLEDYVPSLKLRFMALWAMRALSLGAALWGAFHLLTF